MIELRSTHTERVQSHCVQTLWQSMHAMSSVAALCECFYEPSTASYRAVLNASPSHATACRRRARDGAAHWAEHARPPLLHAKLVAINAWPDVGA